jgi:NAD(P)-dependent dehydrogenase (short-subunit alcohol dehydrogenase family)
MTVLITGASSGIGAATARLLAEQGQTVGIVGRRADRLAGVLAACQAHTPDSRMWVADLGDPTVAEGIADEAWSQFAGLDVLINNAAIPKRRAVAELDTAEVEEVMRVNFLSGPDDPPHPPQDACSRSWRHRQRGQPGRPARHPP